MSAWDNLSIREKAAMMRTAVSNGITNIDDIRREYNEFAEGGPTRKEIEDLFWQNRMDEAQAALNQVPQKAPTPIIDRELPELTVYPQRNYPDPYSIPQGEITPVTGNALTRAVNNYTGELKYDLANNRVPSGKYTLPTAVLGATGIAGLAKAGEMAYAAGATPLIMEGMNVPFAANGLDNLAHGNADWQTALEIAPLGHYVMPIAKRIFPRLAPKIVDKYAAIKEAYNRNPEISKVGSIDDYNDYLKTVFPESKIQDIQYHMGPKGIEELKGSTGEIWNTNPKAKGIYVSPTKEYPELIRKHTTDRIEKPSALKYLWRNLTGNWDKANAKYTEMYPVLINTKNPLYTSGNWTWGMNQNKYDEVFSNYDGIVNSGTKWYQKAYKMPETIVPSSDQTLILGSNRDLQGFKQFMSKRTSASTITPEDAVNGIPENTLVTTPQITAENAASITPEVTHFYHGSPVRFDAFSADFIGSGEGGSKVMRGINLWPTERIANAPKLANIRSSDAPLHLGVPSTPLGGELNPTVYDVSGRGLKLYTANPREVKGLSQSDLISQGYDGIQTPNQVTVFPESIGKLSIDKQSTIEEFVRAHPEVEKWTPWTTNKQKMQNIIDMSKMSKWTPEQWTAAQDAAIAKGDMAEAQRLRDLHFKVSAPNSAAVDENRFPLSLFHGTRTAKGIREKGFSKSMSGKGNRGANEGNIYLSNNYENAKYTGVKAHEIDPIIDKVSSVYDLFDSKTIPSIKQIYSQADDLSKQSAEIVQQLHKLRTGTVWDRISTSLGLKNSPSNRAKKLQNIIDSNDKKITELNRRANIASYLDDGLSFIGGNRDRTVVNTLNFIKEPVNPTSPYRQIAADRVINAMYGTTDQIYSPEVLRLYGNFESPLLSDFKMSPTDINPLKAGKWSPISIDYNNREKALLQELAKPQYDSSISKNKFDVLFGDVYITKKPNSLKSADAVTYDNNGVRIPLGERDNFNINDIRYALLPALGVGTASSLLNLNNLEPSEQTPHMQALGGNLFANGGIHIKPSHRGRLTELKARTGKTEAELYNDGNPAHKKMVVFARNARKWHDLGGTLFPDGGSMNPSVGKAMQYFINKGLTDYQAAGLVGNLMRESSLDHKAVNKDSNAYGLAQWLGDRKTSLFKKYGNNPTFEQQLDYVWDELNSTHKNGLKMLKASKSAEEAARNAMGYYEFSAGPEKAIANMIKHGQDGEGSMRKGVNFAMGIVGQNPVEYVPQMQLSPNYNVLQNWELPTPQYTLDKLTASGTMMPAKELPLTTRIPSSGERPNALLDLLAQYQYLDSLLSQ